MKVFCIGSNGLLSSALGVYCEKFNIPLDVTGIEKPKRHSYTSFMPCNLLNKDFESMNFANADLIVYASGAGIQSNLHENVDLIYDLNVNIPISLANYLEKINFHGTFITFGSYFEIGENQINYKWSENDVIYSNKPVSGIYSISKRLLTRFASLFQPSSYRYLHFILPTIYAEYENPFRLIPYTLKNLLTGNENKYTSGTQIREYLYIDDVIQYLFLAVNTDMLSGVYNMAGNEVISIRELVKILYDSLKYELDFEIFGKITRNDDKMQNLQLNGQKLELFTGKITKKNIVDTIPLYINEINMSHD